METRNSECVRWSKDGNVAVLVIDHPPLNVLNHAVRVGLSDALTRVQRDASIAAVVLTGAGRMFSAGADITEFDKPQQAPSAADIITLIDSIQMPVICALHGTLVGGGLEIALACHFRIAAPGSRLGLPEIKLGLIPGAGGTQRLPRLVGMERAMAMILSGETVPAKEALAIGLIDEIVDGDLTAEAVAFARRITRREADAHARARPRGKAGIAARRSKEVRRDGRCATSNGRAGSLRLLRPSKLCAAPSSCRSMRRSSWSAPSSWNCAKASNRRRSVMSSLPNATPPRFPISPRM